MSSFAYMLEALFSFMKRCHKHLELKFRTDKKLPPNLHIYSYMNNKAFALDRYIFLEASIIGITVSTYNHCTKDRIDVLHSY